MKVKITIPTNQSEIPLYAFQDYSKLETPTEIDAVSIFCNIKEEYVRKMPQGKVLEIYTHLAQVLQSEEKFKPTFKLENIEFGFIPDFDAITAGELADLEQYFKIGENEEGKPVIMNIEDTHKAMAVLFRPITNKMGDKYEIAEYEGTKKYAEVMRYMPLSNLRATVVFFSTLRKELLISTLNFMKGEGLTTKEQQILEKNGVGIKTFIQSLEGLISTLKEPQKKIYTKS
jgi:hypothetical protein